MSVDREEISGATLLVKCKCMELSPPSPSLGYLCSLRGQGCAVLQLHSVFFC